MNHHIHAVTGAFGYSGRYITHRLLDQGKSVRTLTNSVHRKNPFGEKVEVFPLAFDQPEKLVQALQGVQVLYNTYWVRFNHKLFKHQQAVDNTILLFEAAKAAGVSRIVHVSITNPSKDLGLEYFHGKAILEEALIQTKIPYAILRPAVIFGKEDILINNIAWVLRRFPIFGLFGDGSYKIQPIYVDDLASLAVDQGEKSDNTIVQAIGPETFTYRELVETVAGILNIKRSILALPPALGYVAATIAGWMVNDVIITWEEIKGLMANTLYVDAPPTGQTKLTDWIRDHADTLGKSYTSELARRRDRNNAYRSN